MNDIVKKKSLREVLPKEETDHKTTPTATKRVVAASLRFQQEGYKGVSHFFWAVAIVTILVIVYFLSQFYASASIKIKPRQADINTQGAYQAAIEPTDNPLGYSVISEIKASESRTLPADGTEHVEKKASGRVTIFNNFNTASQELVANTRLETKDGKIFRLTKAVTVPGQTKKGTETVPGSAEAEVVADKVGPDYNLSQGDFTIPGFKGSPRYTGFYARVKTALTGGFSGDTAKISDMEKTKARQEMEQALTKKLAEQAKQQIPKNFILPEDGLVVTFDEQIEAGEGKEAKLTLTGTLSAGLFDIGKLARYLVEKNGETIGMAEVTISNPEALTFKLLNKEILTTPGANQNLSFEMSGSAHVVWVIDQKGLRAKLAGKKEADYQNVFKTEPYVERAEAIFRPPWFKTFPTNPDKVQIDLILTN